MHDFNFLFHAPGQLSAFLLRNEIEAHDDCIKVQKKPDWLPGRLLHQLQKKLFSCLCDLINRLFRHLSLFNGLPSDIAFFLHLYNFFVNGRSADLYPFGNIPVLHVLLQFIGALRLRLNHSQYD